MRDTGPIRVRRGGDDSRVSSYLGLARKILGEVKQRAAAGGLATLYRALTLSDGTWIRVGTVHGQDLVEIVPMGGGAVFEVCGLFLVIAGSDPECEYETRALIKRSSAGRWFSEDDSGETRSTPTNPVDWHQSIPPWRGECKATLQWRGANRRYAHSTGTDSFLETSLSLNNRSLGSQPKSVWGACLFRDPEAEDGPWFVRAIFREAINQITIRQAPLLADDSLGSWATLDTKDTTDFDSDADDGLTLTLGSSAFWNASGTEAIFVTVLSTGRRVFTRITVGDDESVSYSEIARGPEITATITRTGSWGLFAIDYGTWDMAVSSVSEDMVMFADWDVDDIVLATVEVDDTVSADYESSRVVDGINYNYSYSFSGLSILNSLPATTTTLFSETYTIPTPKMSLVLPWATIPIPAQTREAFIERTFWYEDNPGIPGSELFPRGYWTSASDVNSVAGEYLQALDLRYGICVTAEVSISTTIELESNAFSTHWLTLEEEQTSLPEGSGTRSWTQDSGVNIVVYRDGNRVVLKTRDTEDVSDNVEPKYVAIQGQPAWYGNYVASGGDINVLTVKLFPGNGDISIFPRPTQLFSTPSTRIRYSERAVSTAGDLWLIVFDEDSGTETYEKFDSYINEEAVQGVIAGLANCEGLSSPVATGA